MQRACHLRGSRAPLITLEAEQDGRAFLPLALALLAIVPVVVVVEGTLEGGTAFRAVPPVVFAVRAFEAGRARHAMRLLVPAVRAFQVGAALRAG